MRDWLALPSSAPSNTPKDDGIRSKCITHHDMTFIEEEEEEEEEQVIDMKRSLSTSSMTSIDSDRSLSSNYIEHKICWNHGGKKVQVTGEFVNWSVPVDMIKDTDCHVVYLQMDSTKDIEFKFIVDGEWKYAIDLPHREDWRGIGDRADGDDRAADTGIPDN
ncbi:hypothetical protein INT48_007541 [Thamnidium elegans]|uniref:AMP-activated protein kinase glycogen-binding domain-containing protein n=1 Tax=Thamnidium elegans TaxID=101142 RepID=A0A8H7SNA4_9FUNG|nr:hypothetical protein INT48_007541 [Thamnidium elegans]